MSPSPKPPKRQPDWQFLTKLKALGYQRIIGIDEVGRGALAGPLIVAAVELTSQINGVTDSKLITKQKRKKLAYKIHQQAEQIKLGWATNQEIDRLGFTPALRLAYDRTLEQVKADLVLTDNISLPGHCFIRSVKGDQFFYPVAAASIVAKVYRDQLMNVYHQFFPEYLWATNVGYGTATHIESIRRHSFTSLHRQSFL